MIIKKEIILKKAQKQGWAIGQFNISNQETLKAIFQAAKKLKSPVIIGTSEGESNYVGLDEAVALVRAFEKKTGVPAILNLDHGKSFEYIKGAIAAGYDSVHFDGSKLPLKKNIEIAKKIVEYAHKKNTLVEGEVGIIRGVSESLKNVPEMKKKDLTKPEEALEFIKKTGVDSLAINIGTFHGVKALGQSPHIDLQRLKEIKEKLGNRVFLVLHGGSGTPDSDIKKAIKLGIVKININTDLRIAFTNNLKKVFQKKLKETTPYKYMPEVVEAIQKVVEEKIKLFNSVNKI